MHKLIGTTQRDIITGLVGVVTAYCEYITGCNQVLIQPVMQDDPTKLIDSVWIDEQRLSRDKSKDKITINNEKNPGFGPPAPRR